MSVAQAQTHSLTKRDIYFVEVSFQEKARKPPRFLE